MGKGQEGNLRRTAAAAVALTRDHDTAAAAAKPTALVAAMEKPLLGKDVGKSVSALPYTFAFLPMALLVAGAYLGGAANYIVPVFVFVLVPLLDLVVPADEYNITDKAVEKNIENTLSFRLVTWLFVPLEIGCLVFSLWAAATFELTTAELVGLIFSQGLIAGTGINTAHELFHKAPLFEKILGRILLVSVCYSHFETEHLLGHHKHVSTVGDPASARRGETVYGFVPRSILFSFVDAWKIEAARLRGKGKAVWSTSNNIIAGVAASALVAAACFHVGGAGTLVFFLAQSAIAIVLLEMINFTEHYGLERDVVDGRAEAVSPMHSWNAPQRVTNYLLFKLQRHSDHHAFAGRRYQILRSWTASPQLPTGYAGMILLSVVPPLFDALMGPRIDQAYADLKRYKESGINPFPSPTASVAASS